MELDIDSFLRSRGGDVSSEGSDEDESTAAHRRTVDEILNDTDSDSSSSHEALSVVSYSLPESRSGHIGDQSSSVAELLEEPEELSSYHRYSVGHTGHSNASIPSHRSLPSLFSGVRSNPKPGAAFAAAVAASRSIPTPHVAAIKIKRASSEMIRKVLLPDDAADVPYGDASFASEVFDEPNLSLTASSKGRLESLEDDRSVDFFLPSQSFSSPNCDVSAFRMHKGESVSTRKEQSRFAAEGESSDYLEEDSFHTISDLPSYEQIDFMEVSEDLPFHSPSTAQSRMNVLKINDGFQFAKEADTNGDNASPTNEAVLKNLATEADSSNTSDGEDSNYGNESINLSEADSLAGQIENQIENINAVDGNLCALMKPLDWAEELEKQKASSGLHWEEGAAAQPMRLEGIHRGPPAIGYLQMDLDNAVTRVISSQTFKHDYGFSHVLAVHMNFIAIGTSKGFVLVFPSKYSPHHVDNMDGKMLIFGSSGEKLSVPVTSMCFNQQGDLLLAGYSDGHLTIWDVQRGASAKVITGEHNAPVTHTLFLGQDSQVSRQFKAVTGDSKGLVLLHTSSVLILNHFTIKTQCLLDGQKNGTVLCACPVVMDYSQEVSSTSGVIGGDIGWRLFNGNPSIIEQGVVVFATNQNALVVRLSPSVEVYENLSKPDGVREGSMPYAAWKCMGHSQDSSTDASDKIAWLAIAWDKKVQIARLAKSEFKKHREWILDSTSLGVAWLDDQMLVVLTIRGQLCLFSRDETELHRTNLTVDFSNMDDFIIYHNHYLNASGNFEKAYHNSVAVRGATIYVLGPMHLIISRLLPWKERIQVLQKAGDWMGALDMAMTLYDGNAHGVIDLPKTMDAIREAIMPYLLDLILLYVDEVFSYISISFYNQKDKAGLKEDQNITLSYVRSEIEEQYARACGVAVEFCVHIKKTNLLFDGIFSKFVSAHHEGTFLEILEPYILKDMLGCLPPEIMQSLVEHYSSKGWLERVEQCVLHMDISSLDFNQVVRLCREHALYGALIYLFNRGLDDYRTPLEELLLAAHSGTSTEDTTIGYRMLVYLKYCFEGLAFPPGHGYLPPSRLPSVRKELLDYLLENSKVSTAQLLKKLKSSCKNFPNLLCILCFDTEASLNVLKCAFKETECSIDQSISYVAASNIDIEKQHDIAQLQTQFAMAQRTANMLISILTLESDKVLLFDMDDSSDIWPSEKDVHFILEFIAYLVASKKATISERVLKYVLEYLTSNVFDHSVKDGAFLNEKQVLSVLKAVPHEIWNSSFVLPLCIKAKFYQASGFIHYVNGEYVAALDSYMKDLNEPVHAFSFINKMFLELDNLKALSFRSEVILRISELVKLNRECTFVLVCDQLGDEKHNILSELHKHPHSLFLFLKTVIDVHISGTLKFLVLENVRGSNYLNDRMKNSGIEIADYLEKLLNFPKVLHLDTIQVTNEMVELYLELLCQFERNSVLKFLETFDNYRLEHCLKLCQEYGVADASAFLLERVGDVGSALALVMSGFDEKIKLLVFSVAVKFSDVVFRKLSEAEQLVDILKLTEVNALHDVLHASIALCQRNTQRLDFQESESLWFRLFDSFSELLGLFRTAKEAYKGKLTLGKLIAGSKLYDETFSGYKIFKYKSTGNILRRLFSQFIGEITEGMAGCLPLPAVISKLFSDNKNQEFGDYKMTILKMLGIYNYEKRILDTAKSLIEDDMFYTMCVLKNGALHSFAPQNSNCCCCGLLLNSKSSPSGIRVFSCGHAIHLTCESRENESHSILSASRCPICHLRKNPRAKSSESAVSDNGLVSNFISTSQHNQGNSSSQHQYESDLMEKQYSLQQISRFDILNNLKEGKLAKTNILPQLRLAPPAIYHEKIQNGQADSIRDMNENAPNKGKTIKSWQLKELKSKGPLSRLPLKSNFFGTQKNKVFKQANKQQANFI